MSGNLQQIFSFIRAASKVLPFLKGEARKLRDNTVLCD
jgi:hypothetical protein